MIDKSCIRFASQSLHTWICSEADNQVCLDQTHQPHYQIRGCDWRETCILQIVHLRVYRHSSQWAVYSWCSVTEGLKYHTLPSKETQKVSLQGWSIRLWSLLSYPHQVIGVILIRLAINRAKNPFNVISWFNLKRLYLTATFGSTKTGISTDTLRRPTDSLCWHHGREILTFKPHF